jgi:hypothetical protein
MHDIEFSTIVHALKMWRRYLIGRKFELRTYHCGVKHLFGQPTLNARQTIWIKFLSEYDFEIKHIKDKENEVADALRRRAHEMDILAISMYMIDMKDKIIVVANSDQQYLRIKETLQQGNLQQKFKYYELKEYGILMCKGKIYLSNSNELKNAMMREMHNVPYVGHPGYQKTIATMRSQYFCPGMKKEVANYIARCIEYQKVKTKHRHTTGLLQPFPIPKWN